jgi:signal transduction histidine kinase
MVERLHRPLVRAGLAALAVLVLLALVATLGALMHIRSQVSSASRELAVTAAAIAGEIPDRPTPEQIQAFAAPIPYPLLLTGKAGQPILRTGPATGLWERGPAHWTGRLALTGSSARLVDGAVDVTRALPNGRAITLRRDIGRDATGIDAGTATVAGGVALLLALLAGLLSFFRVRRVNTRVERLVSAAESVAAGRRPGPDELLTEGPFARLGLALQSTAERLTHLTEVADRELAVLAAAIEPLPIGVAGRGPSGGRLRNLSLERLIEGLSTDDRAGIETAIQEGLDATGPVGSRVTLRDGRAMEVDGWSVPGGRLVSVAERTEQDRLGALRRQLESSAVRQLRAPIDEIKARGKELYQQLPAPAAPTLRAVFAATDRLDRVVRKLLRGTQNDPALLPPRRETFGVAGLLWGLVHDWDAALRQRALRVELDISPDLPNVRTDPALVEEILTELVDNSAKFTPRGGTVSLVARPGERAVVIEVRDTGGGIHPADAEHATERFFRGQLSESIPGAGLGLGVAAALTDRLGGVLVIEPGPGGHVRLELPALPTMPAAELLGV